jgi:hypothetical protein
MRVCKVTAGNSEKQMIELLCGDREGPKSGRPLDSPCNSLRLLRGLQLICIHFINWSKQSQFGSLCKLVEWLECDINGEIKHMMKNKSCRCMIKREMFRLPPLG